MAREMAKLRHLQPPSLFSVEFHRFSPYHSDPAAFAIRLRPSPSYRSLYPFPDEEIARIAYMFVRDDEPADPPYAQEMREEVAAWQAGFQVDRCSLVWRDEGASILVRDRRPGWTPADYRLGGFAAALFRAIDGPKKLQSLIKEAQSAGTGCDQAAPVAGVGEVLIAFTREEFARDSERWVQRLVDAGIVYAEDDRLLALPVMEQLRPLGGGWSRPDS